MLVQDLLRRAVESHPDKPAVIAEERRFSFQQLDLDSDKLAVALQRLGVTRGDRVAAMLENSVELVLALWGALKAGAVFVPLHTTSKPHALAATLANAGVKCLIAQQSFQTRVKEAITACAPEPTVIWTGSVLGDQHFSSVLAQPHETPADPGLIDQDLCLLIYTSGSTGNPKGVMLTHRTVRNNAWAIATYLRAVPADVVLSVLPLSFSYGLFQMLSCAHAACTVILERSFAFPIEVLRQMSRHGVTGLPGVPTLFARLLELAPYVDLDLSKLRYVTSAAAPFPPAHLSKLREALPHVQVYSMYGLTECTRVCYMDPARLDQKVASVGRAIPNCEAYVVNEFGDRCAAGVVGELVVRGSNLMRGYWGRPEETARALREGPIPGEKLLYTGDLFYADEEGDLFFVGRVDDVFKCRGEKVSPRDVENVLHECDGVAEAAVVGVPDPIDGMAVKAFVVRRDAHELTADALRKHCQRRLENWLVPRFIEFCETLPHTENGKLARRALRDQGGSKPDDEGDPCAA